MINKNLFYVLFILVLGISTISQAKVELFEFQNNEQQALYAKLSDQLRCLVCQNQNLAGSNAELAQDMRNKTYKLVLENKTEDDIIDYWVSRYGDFVLYDPPFKQGTLILWLGPFVLLIIAVLIGLKIIRNNKVSQLENSSKEQDDEQKADHEAAKKLLDN